MITNLQKNTQLFTTASPEGTSRIIVGMPAGGATGSFLQKSSATDHDAEWGFPVKFAQIEDQKTLDTQGGTFTAGDWVMRDLNVIVTNGLGASILNNRFTLPIGNYFLSAKSAAYRVNSHKLRIYDFTNSVALLYGLNMHSYSTESSANNYAIVEGMINLSAETTLELQHICSATRETNGLGAPSNLGDYETYSSVLIWKF